MCTDNAVAITGRLHFTLAFALATFILPDITPPIVSIATPAAGATVSGVVPLTANAIDDVGVSGVQFKLDGAPLGPEVTAPPYARAWPTLGAADLIFGVIKVAVGPMTISPGTGFTKRLSVSCPSCSGDDTVSEDTTQNVAGSAAATFTFSTAAHYHAHLAAFKTAALPVYLQGAAATTNSGTATLARAFPGSTTAGTLLVAAVAWRGNVPLTVTDSHSNTYAVATTAYDPVMAQSLAILYAINGTPGAATVTATFGTPVPTAQRLEIHEYAGIVPSNPLDATVTAAADGGTTPNAITTGSTMTSAIAPAANGAHTLTAVARDAAGNVGTSPPVTVTVTNGGADTSPPTVAVTSPAAGTTLTGTVTLLANASDNVGVAGVQFQLDGAPLGAEDGTAPYSASWDTRSSTNGGHTLTAVARDAAGNVTTSAAVAVTVANDTTPPIISAVATSAVTASGATITWTTDEASNSQVEYGLTTAYGTSSALNGSLVAAHNVSLNGLSGSTVYRARVRSRDAAGNLAVSGDVTFTTLDGTPPTVSITTPAANATVSGLVPVTASASDNVDVGGVQLKLDGAPLGPEVTAPPYSLAWRTQGASDLIFGVVKVAVGPMTISPGTGFTKRLSVSCPSCSGDDTVTEDTTQTVAGPGAATFTFSTAAHYHAHMAAFKAAAPPTYLQGAATTTNSGTATLARAFPSATTAGTLLVAAVAWRGNVPLTLTDSHSNTYAVATTAYDPVMGQSLAILYAINGTAGTATVTATFGSPVPTAQRLEIHEYTGVVPSNPLDATVTAAADGGTTPNAITTGSTMTSAIAPAANGAHTLTAVARDTAGNVATSSPVMITVNNGVADTTPPTVAVTSPAAGATVSGTITLLANASDNVGVVGVQFQLDGAPLGAEDTVVPYTAVWDTTASSAGSHALTAVARDAAGNRQTSSAVAVTVSNATAQLTLAWNPNTEPTLAGYKVYVGTASGVYGPPVDVGNITTSTVTGLTPGTVYYFVVTAYDVAGNESGFSNEVSGAG